MKVLISNPADCEVRGVIRFLQAENVTPCEIHQRLVAVYGEHVMNAASVRKFGGLKMCCSPSRWPSGLRRRSEAARFLGKRIRIPVWDWIFFSCVCYVV